MTNLWISLGSEMAFQFLKMKMPGKTKKKKQINLAEEHIVVVAGT